MMDEQSSSLDKVRENLKAEVNLVVNSRIMEELQSFDEKMNKKFEENEKRVKTIEKKTDGFKESIEENKAAQANLLARVDDIAKLVAELTLEKTPKNEHSEEIESVKQSLANIGKYREDDLKKLNSLSNIVEENKKANNNKIDSLEKFIITVKETAEREATNIPARNAQTQFEANATVMQDLKNVKSTAENFSYKIEAIKYDLELIKGDIVRQKETQKDYFMKIDKLEKRVDSLPGTNPNFYASHNFMTNQTIAAKPAEDNNILAALKNDKVDLKKSQSTQEGGHSSSRAEPVGKPADQFDFMKELDDEFSLIDGKNDQSGIGEDIFGSSGARVSNIGIRHPESAFGNPPTQTIHNTIGGYQQPHGISPSHQPSINNPNIRVSPPQPFTQQHFGPVSGTHGQISSNYTAYHGSGQASASTYQPQSHTQYHETSQAQYQHPTNSNQATTPATNNPFNQPAVSVHTQSILVSKDPTSQPPVPSQTPSTKPPAPPTQSSQSNKEPISRRVTGGLDGTVNSSMLNQSLNTSIRMQKSQLKKMDQSILEAVASKKGEDDDDDEIELNIDDNGFLIDDKGFPILNDKGEPMKLTEEQIAVLKEQGLYEEKEVSTLE